MSEQHQLDATRRHNQDFVNTIFYKITHAFNISY